MSLELDALGQHDDWGQVRATVAGFGVSGFAAADTLTHLGAKVTVLDEVEPEGARAEQATLLEILGADLRLGAGSTAALPADTDLLVVSPGWRPDAGLIQEASAREIAVWGEVELAWRLRAGVEGQPPASWLAVTGTNGKTTTVQMLDSILRAAGLRSVAVGNVGKPVLEAVMDPEPSDVLAVELSSFQLHYTESMACESAAVLNLAEDHLDWYGLPEGASDTTAAMRAYAADKGRIYTNVSRACVYNVADPSTEQMVRDAEVIEGARAIGFTLGVPSVGMIGVVDDVLADRAFIEERSTSAAELGTVADLAGGGDPAPHVVANALAAAALARAHGVSAQAVREGLRSFRLDGHRIASVATRADVRYVNDSKATNPHAALASLRAYESVVWIAGGLAKGARFDDLVQAVRDRLRAVVLIGQDRQVIAEALSRHAPDVRTILIEDDETGSPMDRAVLAAASVAQPGDTVLMAPGCASMDQFKNYAARGDAFAEAVGRLPIE